MDTTHSQMLLSHLGHLDTDALRHALEDGELLGALMAELGLTDEEMQAAVEDIYPPR